MKRRTFVRSTLAATAAVTIPRSRSIAAIFQEVPQEPPDVPAITGAGNDIVLPGSDIAELAARMDGPVLLAGDKGYDASRLILNPSFDKYPALVVRPTGVADIRAAVDFGRDHDNLLVIAFAADTPPTPDTDRLIQLGLRWGINFQALAERISRLETAA